MNPGPSAPRDEPSTDRFQPDPVRVAERVGPHRGDVPRQVPHWAARALRDPAVQPLTERLTGTGAWAWMPRIDQLVWSENAFRLLGFAPDEVEPTPERFLSCVHPDDRDLVMAAIDAGAAAEFRVVHGDGAIRALRVTPVDDHDPDAILGEMRLGLLQDVTAQRRAAAVRDAHLAVTRILSSWTSMRNDGERLLEQLARGFCCFRAGLYVDREDLLVPIAFWELDETKRDAILELDIATDSSVTGRAFMTGEPILVPDIGAELEPARRAIIDAAAIRGFAAVPLLTNGEVLAVVVLASHDLHAVEPGELRSLEAFACQIAMVLAHRPGELSTPLLSERERELLQLAAEGVDGHHIAARLQISTETVKSHFKRIYFKLEVSDRAAAVAKGMRLGLIA